MAGKEETDKNTANNINCSLCSKFIKILKHKPEGEAKIKCEKCNDDEDDPVVGLCIECKLYLCKVCHDYHSKKHKTHDIVSLSFVTDTAGLSSNQLVEKMTPKYRDMLTKIIATVEEMSKNLSKAEASIVRTQEKIKQQASEIDQEIDKCYVEQLKELNDRHKQLKEQLHDAASQKEDALKEQLRVMKSLQDELIKLTELREGLGETSEHNNLILSEDVESRIEKVSNQYKALNMQPVVYDTLEFVPIKICTSLLGELFISANPYTSEVVDLPAVAYCGHKVEFKIITKDSKEENCTKGGSQVSVQLKSSTGDITVVEVRDNNDGSYMASFVAEKVGEAKLFICINGVQIKGSPYSIVVGRNYQAIDRPTKIVNDNGSMMHPEGIAFNKDGMWAVADWSNHCVYIFDDKDELVTKFGTNGSNNGQFKSPQGVEFDSHNHLYVVDCNNHRVQKFNIKGNYLHQFGSSGSQDGQLSRPYGAAIHGNKVYVADLGNHRISVFRTDGQFCFTFGSDRLADASNVAVSCNNQLLVSDRSNHCICSFTLNGHYVGKFGTPGSGSGQLKSPFLTTDLNGFILIAERENHRVSIFNKDGSYMHCFGSKGSSNGQFDTPYGIAVSPNGCIYVSDRGNSRIQIFTC